MDCTETHSQNPKVPSLQSCLGTVHPLWLTWLSDFYVAQGRSDLLDICSLGWMPHSSHCCKSSLLPREFHYSRAVVLLCIVHTAYLYQSHTTRCSQSLCVTVSFTSSEALFSFSQLITHNLKRLLAVLVGNKAYFTIEAVLCPPEITLSPSCNDLYKMVMSTIRECVYV